MGHNVSHLPLRKIENVGRQLLLKILYQTANRTLDDDVLQFIGGVKPTALGGRRYVQHPQHQQPDLVQHSHRDGEDAARKPHGAGERQDRGLGLLQSQRFGHHFAHHDVQVGDDGESDHERDGMHHSF